RQPKQKTARFLRAVSVGAIGARRPGPGASLVESAPWALGDTAPGPVGRAVLVARIPGAAGPLEKAERRAVLQFVAQRGEPVLLLRRCLGRCGRAGPCTEAGREWDIAAAAAAVRAWAAVAGCPRRVGRYPR